MSVKSKGKQILEGILNESNFSLQLTKIKNIDYILNENLGIKLVVRERKRVEAEDSIYIEIKYISNFDNACKDNDLLPYICYVQILENNINIFLFSLQKARKDITNNGLNVRIYED